MKSLLKAMLTGAASVVILAGCGDGGSSGGGGVDVNKPVAEVQQEAQKLDTAALQKQVDAYKGAIEAKKPEVERIQKELKEIPLTDMLGDKAKGLKDDISKLNVEISKLQERMEVYASELSKKK